MIAPRCVSATSARSSLSNRTSKIRPRSNGKSNNNFATSTSRSMLCLTPTSSSSLGQPLLRPLSTPPRSSFSRIPFESLDYERVSDDELRRRRRKRRKQAAAAAAAAAAARRRRKHRGEDDEDDDDEDDAALLDQLDALEDHDDDDESEKHRYEDDSFEDDEDSSGLPPGFPMGPTSSSALPGTQVARLKDLAAQSAARRDFHFAFYRAHSAKSNLLSAVVLVCTTAGGTSGLISLASSAAASSSGVAVPDAAAAAIYPGMTSAAAQAARDAAAAAAAHQSSGPGAAALLSPILGYAATLVSGLQNYSKPSTAASRHLTAYKRYQVIARHCRDALRYGATSSYARVIMAVERKMDQYEDESPTIPDIEIGGSDFMDGEAETPLPPPKPPSPLAAFWSAMVELPQ